MDLPYKLGVSVLSMPQKVLVFAVVGCITNTYVNDSELKLFATVK